jgi:hypothetical protein
MKEIIYKPTLPSKAVIHNLRRNKNLPLQTKAKAIYHH